MKKVWEIRDPLHGYIKVDETERRIIDTSSFQRLKRIKQLAMVHLVYPGAEHSRFTHSLGVVETAGRIARNLVEQGLMDEGEVKKARLAALLHDVGHGPFSHTFEDLLWERRGMHHEDVTQWIVREGEIGEILEEDGYDEEEISDLAVGKREGDDKFVNEIVAGPYCADILDYLVRDAYFAGVAYGNIDVDRIVESLSVVGDELALKTTSLYALEAYVIARYEMFKAVYFHRTARAANAMILEAMRLAEDELQLTSFDEPEDYLELTDDLVIHRILEARGGEDTERAKELVRDLLSRRLVKMTFERLYQTKDDFFNSLLKEEQTRGSLRRRIATEAGVREDQVFMDFPSVMSLPHYVMKGDYPAYIEEGGERRLVSIPTLSTLIESLRGYTNLIRVYSPADVREKVEEASQKVLGEVDYTTQISY